VPDYRIQDGQVLLEAADEQALMSLLRSATLGRNADELRAFGALVTEPISTVADYEEWADRLFVPRGIGVNDDPSIPLEEYNLTAFYSSPEGRWKKSRVGWLNVRPEFSIIESAFEIFWGDLERATWNVIGNKIMRTGQEMARKRDQLAFGVIQAAANSVGQVVNTTGGALTRASVDAMFKRAAASGFPIKRVIANHATLMDMRSAGFFSFDAAGRFPMGMLPPERAQELMDKGYIANYGGAEWYGTLGLSPGTLNASAQVGSDAAVIIYTSGPDRLGYNVTRGQTHQYTDMSIEDRVNRYYFDESRFYYITNPYAVWVQVITV
jgi:hypothetical protein